MDSGCQLVEEGFGSSHACLVVMWVVKGRWYAQAGMYNASLPQ